MAKMMDRVQRQVMKEKLANFDLLKDLPLAAKEELMSVVEQVHYPKGSVLFYEGESSFDLFLILDGEVTVYKKSPSAEEQEQGAQPHAGGTQVGRTVPLDGVQRHAVGMQVACRWGAPCPPKKVQRHAVGHAGNVRGPPPMNETLIRYRSERLIKNGKENVAFIAQGGNGGEIKLFPPPVHNGGKIAQRVTADDLSANASQEATNCEQSQNVAAVTVEVDPVKFDDRLIEFHGQP
ncbi:hypothetical protein AK812_SmicGene14955 [Symbiodinium microadriaticum]|uniref:Cyclic nucleotide-binding domain-containing protein n=1 Tax=Symbiodinium microadriaticum TaxID=2951 RepID=A0A1Q9E454_SYMMI|nr:hypothetical protein AK812_SmicGene14955 [Symbiodinium microadriaticum]